MLVKVVAYGVALAQTYPFASRERALGEGRNTRFEVILPSKATLLFFVNLRAVTLYMAYVVKIRVKTCFPGMFILHQLVHSHSSLDVTCQYMVH